jgi:hypothetical protein
MVFRKDHMAHNEEDPSLKGPPDEEEPPRNRHLGSCRPDRRRQVARDHSIDREQARFTDEEFTRAKALLQEAFNH